MSYDANRITELLAQLQNSSAFQNTVTPNPSSQTPVQQPENTDIGASINHTLPAAQSNTTPQASSTPSIFELLSRLNPDAAPSGLTEPPRPSPVPESSQQDATTAPRPVSGAPPALNLRYMTVQQALPHISKLVQGAEFRDKIKRMQDRQNLLEQSLYSDQQEVLTKHEERVGYARNRATIIGVPLSDKENEELASQLAADLKKFHQGRLLVAWDAQRTKQQKEMEALGVPCMFVTSEQAAIQRQQKVLRILLESINESEDME
ncbi:DiGeorge syndrome critical region 6 (DGCR6) protein [Ceratobasidium sp. AG-Ba]|nr:DiGeorge syndrome critical region 6 (DGCR6) protein [Ceratobasidium sp. AG-Ba]